MYYFCAVDTVYIEPTCKMQVSHEEVLSYMYQQRGYVGTYGRSYGTYGAGLLENSDGGRSVHCSSR